MAAAVAQAQAHMAQLVCALVEPQATIAVVKGAISAQSTKAICAATAAATATAAAAAAD